MRILAIDTTTEACSAALLLNGQLITRAEEPGRGHAERILTMIDEILAEAGATLDSLDGVAACIGPGAFTGVRISVAIAQGLCFGAGLKAVPVSSLEALAYARMREGVTAVLACLDARMNEVYWGCYRADPLRGVRAIAGPALGAPGSVFPPENAVGYAGVGRGLAAYPELSRLAGVRVEPADLTALPQAGAIAELGTLRLAAGEAVEPAALAPLYLRDNVALTEAQRGVH